jgi:AcrR family transcriptional regulator
MGRMSETRQRILDMARAMFNERGLHRVGVRDIAREAGMSPGNLAYHFPTKDSLVSALMAEIYDRNRRAVFGRLPDDFSVVILYRSAVAVMRNILDYRFALLSYVDTVMASEELQRLEASFRVKRRQRSDAMMRLLAQNGYLDQRAFDARAEYVHEQGELISSGWLSAEVLQGSRRGDEATVLHYAKVGCVLLEPYFTPRGARQMKQILAGTHDEGLWASVGAMTGKG